MPRKTRRRISGTRKSRRIRRRGTRRSGTRIRGGNRRYHNGGFFLTSIKDGFSKVTTHPSFIKAQQGLSSAAQQGLSAAKKKLLTNPSATSHTPTSQTP